MAIDKNGMEDIYPKLSGGYVFVMDNSDPDKDNHFQPGGSVDKFVSKGSGWWGVDDPGQVRLSIKKFPEFEDSIDGCNLDFKETDKRGYAYKKGDFRDIEVKMLLDVRSLDEHVLIGGPTGHHPSDSSPCCQGASYFIRFQNTSTFRMQFGKEMYHHDGYESLDPVANSNVHSTRLQNQDIGIAYCRYNRTGTGGRREVVIEGWVDTNADGKDWKLFKREVDFIGRGWNASDAPGTVCGGVKDQPLFWGNGRIRIRWDDDNADVRFKSVTLREIAPGAPTTQPGGQTGGGGGTTGGGGGGGTTTGPPVPTEPVKGFIQFKFQRHVNYYGGNFCAATNDPVTDPKTVYSQLTRNGIPGTELDHNGAMTGEVIKDKLSKLWNLDIQHGTVYLTKIGSGTNVKVEIRDSANRTKTTLATISAASINTSETAVPFSNPSSTYITKVGDRFCIVEDGSPSTTNCIAVSHHNAVIYDDPHTKRFTLLNGKYLEQNGDIKAIIQGYEQD